MNSSRSPDPSLSAARPAVSTPEPSPSPLPPRVSVIVPTFRSAGTLRACLEALSRQTLAAFELVIIDSTPSDDAQRQRTRDIVRAAPASLTIRHIESETRLWPHQARNLGVRHARADRLVFTDPDIYPEPGWLEALVRAQAARGGVIFGPLACAGRRWFDIGVHLCKFAICLPERAPRAVAFGWSGNMLCDRATFEAVGGFPGQPWHGDTLISARLREAGVPLWLEPAAVVRHDHEAIRWRPFLRERFARGAELATLSADGRLTGTPWTRVQRLRRVLTTMVWPVKVGAACVVVARGAARAGMTRDFLVTLPIVAAGQSAWVIGASLRYLADGLRPASASRPPDASAP